MPTVNLRSLARWSRIAVSLFVLLGRFTIAMGSPIDGELFGYQLGSRYPVTNDTKGRPSIWGAAEILAEKAEKPVEFQRVEMITTPKTFTIVNIYGIAELPDEKQAKAFAAQYADLLSAAHGSKCSPAKAYLGESLKLVCKGQYELTVHYFGPDKIDNKHKVHVGLTFDDVSKAWTRIHAQMEQEIKQLEAEGKTNRLEQARKEQKLRGLQ